MGNLLARFRQKDARIIFLGLDSAGKTTILYRLKLDDLVTTVPTIGFNVETIHYKDMHLTAWDIGSKDKVRPLFRQYYKGADAVVFVIDSQDPERLDELNYDVVKPAVGAEELTSAVFLFLANKMDLPATMTTDQIADRLGLRFLKHPWGILPVSAVSGDGLQAALEWLAVRLGSHQVRPKTFASPLDVKSPSVPCRNTLSSLSSSASSNATWRTESTKGRMSKLGSFRASSVSGPNAVPKKPVILLNSRLYREAFNGNTTSPSSGSGGNSSPARMSMSGESNPATRQTPQGAYHAQNRPSYYDLHQNTPKRAHGSVVNCFSSYSISQSMREDLRGARKFSTISQSDIRRLSCASLTVHAAEGRRQSCVSLQERYNGNRKMSAASLADGPPYRRKMSTTFIIDPPNYRKFSSASLMESPFARKYSDASLTDSLPGQRKMSSVSAVAALGGSVDTPPEEIRPNLSYLTVTPNIVATPPTGKRKSVDLALQGFGQFTPMMADYFYNGMKDSDTSADSLNLVSGSTGHSSSTTGMAGATPSPSKDPAGHLRSLSMLRKSSLRVTKGRYTVNQPLSAAAAHPMVDQYTEELYRKMPEKYGSLTGRKSINLQNSPIIPPAPAPPPAAGTDGGSDSGAEVLLPVPSRNPRRESLLSPRKHGYNFTLPTSANKNITKSHAANFISQERRQSRTPRKSSVSHERRNSKSLESLKAHGRRHSRSTGASKDKDRRHSKSSTGRHERRQSKSKETERRHSKSTAKSEERRHSKSSNSKSAGRKRSRSGTSTEGESRHSNSPGERRQSKSSGISKDDRRFSRVEVDVILEERRSSNSSGIQKDRRNSKSPSVSPNSRRHSRSPAPPHGRRQSRGREIHISNSNNNSSSSSSRSNSRKSSRNSSCESDSSASATKNQRSSTFDLFTCSPIHKRWVLPYSCGGGRVRKSQTTSSATATATNRFPSSVAPACFRAYSALKCLFFRPTQREMRSQTCSVSSDDDAEIEEEEGDEKESEGDGDDEAEECDERREMLTSSARSTMDNKLGIGYSLRARTEVECHDDMGLPTCRVTVTVEEADEEDISSKDDDIQDGGEQTAPLNPDTNTTTPNKLNSETGDTTVCESLKTQISYEDDNKTSEKKKLPLTAVDSGIQDNSPSMENYDSFTTDNSTDGPFGTDRLTPIGHDPCSKLDNTGNVDLDLELSDLGNDEIILDSDLLVEIDECFDNVFSDKENTREPITDSESNTCTVKDIVKSQTDQQQKTNVLNSGMDNDFNTDEETALEPLLKG